MKKSICLLMTFIMCAASLYLVPVSASTEGVLTYEIFDGEVTITGCNRQATEVEIPSTIGGLPVTKIGKEAFKYGNLTSVIIPDSVTSLGERVFQSCDKLVDVKMSKQTIVIPAYAFWGCSRLENVRIPESVTKIGEFSFGRCVSLVDIDIPNKVTLISGGAFQNCSVLSKVSIPRSVTIIGDSAFSGCAKLGSIVVPDSVTRIEAAAFSDCTSLVNVKLSNTLPGLLTAVFRGCSSLTNIDIPDSVTWIGTNAFYGCGSLKHVAIPIGVTEIFGGAFANCSALTNITVENGNAKLISQDGVLFNKYEDKIIQYPAGKLGESYIIPDSVTTIDEQAFSGCNNLSDIVLSNNVKWIESDAFKECSSLTSIFIPDSVIGIMHGEFSGCRALNSITVGSENKKYASQEGVLYDKEKTVIIKYPDNKPNEIFTIPSGVQKIGRLAFEKCKNLEQVCLPATVVDGVVTNSSNSIFADCCSLTAISVASDNPKYLSQNGVLFDKKGMSLIQYPANKEGMIYQIPESVTQIYYCAFVGCNNLSNVIIPDSITDIYGDTFKNCIGLTSIFIPGSVKIISDNAFSGCSNLTIFGSPGSYAETYAGANDIPFKALSGQYEALSYMIEGGEVTITGCDREVTEVAIPATIEGLPVTKIGSGAFRFSNLTNITIPDSITDISDFAFANCDYLEAMTIPDSVVTIGYKAFAQTNMSSLTIPHGVTSIGEYAFYWSAFTNIQISDSVTSIGDNAFTSCRLLTSIDVSSANPAYTSENGILFDKEKKKLFYYPIGKEESSYIIPYHVNLIGAFAFQFSEYLNDVIIPSSVTSIGESAFNRCHNLASVTIAESVTTISDDAFFGCENLTLYGYPGSYVETYARDISIPFEVIKHITLSSEAVSKTESGYHFDVALTSYETAAEDAKVVAVVYGGNSKNTYTLGVQDQTVSVAADGSASVSMDVPVSGDGSTYKIFLWDGLSTMRPLARPYEGEL